jgi:glycosyltransferase involved in cell wall biosynthesis
MIVPLKSGGGVRIKILEAMAGSNAIVATDLAADGLQTIHQKNILIANDAEQMANEIIAALQNNNLLQQLRKEARLHAELYFNQTKLMQDFLDTL